MSVHDVARSSKEQTVKAGHPQTQHHSGDWCWVCEFPAEEVLKCRGKHGLAPKKLSSATAVDERRQVLSRWRIRHLGLSRIPVVIVAMSDRDLIHWLAPTLQRYLDEA